MLESAVDRLCRTVARAGQVEEREDVRGALLQRPTEPANLGQHRGDATADGIDHRPHHLLRLLLVGFAVGGDDALVDAPGRFDLDVLLDREHRVQPCSLLLGEEAHAGVEGAADPVERVPGVTAVPESVLLNPLPGPVQGVTGEPDDMERIHHRDRVGEFLGRGGLEPTEPIHRDHFDLLRPLLGPGGEPLLEHRLRPTLDHVQQPCGTCLVAGGREVDDHGHVLVTEPGVTPDVLVDADRGDAVEPGRIVDQPPLALGEDRGVRGVPRHPQACRGAGDGEVVDHDRLQRPPDPAAGDLRPRRRRVRRVLPPGAAAVAAPVAAHPHQQRRGPVTERLVRERTRHGVARHALGATLPTPRVIVNDAALEYRPVGLDQLADGFEAELIETAERGEVRGRERRVAQVEVFRQMGSVRTSILEDLDVYPRTSRRPSTTPSTAKSQKTVNGNFQASKKPGYFVN